MVTSVSSVPHALCSVPGVVRASMAGQCWLALSAPMETVSGSQPWSGHSQDSDTRSVAHVPTMSDISFINAPPSL